MTPLPLTLAYFISPHGYGHAARASAVMTALRRQNPTAHFEIFTRVPRWFFEDSLAGPFGYHETLTDIGLAQRDSLREDLPETIRRLAAFLPFNPSQVEALAGQVNRLNCRLVLCDISPLGLAVAKAAGLPSILIENFTWDWIYQGYLSTEPTLAAYINQLQTWFSAADYHLQTKPVCLPNSPHLTTGPVSRPARTPAAQTRRDLGLPQDAPTVLLTMGGIPWEYTFLERLTGQRDYYFIIPGAGIKQPERRDNLILLPHQSRFYHPDLVSASHAVIGKLGYSTLAEAYHAGLPYGYIPRPHFRESAVMAGFVDRQMGGLPITAGQFENGDWLSLLPDLLNRPPLENRQPNGANQVAEFIGALVE
jgi:UDP:flavonoid glycosyltransferase YjiC (YdhE family)